MTSSSELSAASAREFDLVSPRLSKSLCNCASATSFAGASGRRAAPSLSRSSVELLLPQHAAMNC
eukprot:7274072-Pyramimonas_sp.AAC.2